jgi:hypothetical protein
VRLRSPFLAAGVAPNNVTSGAFSFWRSHLCLWPTVALHNGTIVSRETVGAVYDRALLQTENLGVSEASISKYCAVTDRAYSSAAPQSSQPETYQSLKGLPVNRGLVVS